MTRKWLIGGVLAAAATVLATGNAVAKTVVVGAASCQPALQHFATIQAAVNASAVGGTVLVCPGSYPEQVVINQPLSMKGIIDGNAGAAVITVPAAGLVPNVTTPAYGNEAAQLLIQNIAAGQVQLSGIAIDGTGSTCPTSLPGGASRTVGIKLYNVGSRLSSGAFIQGVVVRNQIDGCGLGEGIDIENSWVTLDSDQIHDVDRNGIVHIVGGGVFNNNTLANTAYPSGAFACGLLRWGANGTTGWAHQIPATRGIQLDAGTTGASIVGNVIGPFTTTGIYLNQVSKNRVRTNRIVASARPCGS